MATSDRPSGLTALAVIQFLFGVGQFFEVLTLSVTRFFTGPMVLREHADSGSGPLEESQFEAVRALVETPLPSMLLVLALMSFSFALFIVTGIGFIGRRRWLGRHAATAFVACEMGALVAILVLFPESYARNLGIGLVRMVFYPLFLLACVHLVFRRDLVK